MSGALAGRKAIVTGASRGIGRAIAERFAAEGATVALMSRNRDTLEKVAAGLPGAVVREADVVDADGFRDALGEVVAELGGVDVLVNNAGGNSFSMPLVATRFAGWEKTMRLNVDSIVHACQIVLPGMLSQRSGSIVNVSSVAALRGGPLMAHYAAAKAAVVSIGQSLAIECASSGVRVNTLVPGWIDTDLTDFLRAEAATEEAVLSRVPMQRWGRAEEIASAALFLAEDESSFMTGQSLIIDGGLSAMP